MTRRRVKHPRETSPRRPKARGNKPAAGVGSTPSPSKTKPVAPDWLNDSAQRYFALLVEKLEELNAASDTYSETLALLAVRLAEVERLDAVIDQEGSTYESRTPTGALVIKAHPAYAQRSEAMRHASQLLSEMGLTATGLGRLRVRPGAKKTENNAFADE